MAKILRAWEAGGLFDFEWNKDGELKRHWTNVVAHQTATAVLANAIVCELGGILKEKRPKDITVAVLVHDAYKRREQENVMTAKEMGGNQYEALSKSERESKKFLSDIGFCENVVSLAAATGDHGLKQVLSEETTLSQEIVFYSDCCVSNDQIVGYKKRFDDLLPHFEPGGRYEALNSVFQTEYGKTHREVYDSVVLPLQEKLARLIGFLGDPNDLVPTILCRLLPLGGRHCNLARN